MKQSILLGALFYVILWAISYGQAQETPNLVKNPGFEVRGAEGLPEGWNGPPNVYSHITSPVHSGSGALQFVNPDPNNYALCRQAIPLEPGKMYEFSAWIKCEDIVGMDSGATICLEWYTQDDKYLGGSYPSGIKGTRDWTQIRAISGRVPENATKCYVLCYVRKGMTGKAYWDDVEVRQYREPPLRTMLTKPNYRGIITPQLKQIELVAQLRLQDYELKPTQVRLRGEIVRAEGGAPVRSVRLTPTSAEAKLVLPAQGLAVGSYRLFVILERQDNGAEMARDSWRLNVPAQDLAQRVAYIDEYNRLIVKGEPFFPLGMYWSSVSEADVRMYADSAFNCLMPYGGANAEQLDLIQRYGLKIIYTLKDAYYGTAWCPKEIKGPEDERPFIEMKVKQFRSHPALLAWYLNDELSLEYMPRLEAHQEWLEELDPDHPTWVVLYQVGQLELYRKTFDVLGTDPYPIPTQPPRRAAEWTRQSVASVLDSRPIWMVPQVMNWACYKKTEEEKKGLRPPTYAEMRSMTWQCITEGARGLIYYSWFDLKKEPEVFERRWAEVKQVAAEVKRWMPVLLSVEPAPALKADKQEWLHWTVRRVGQEIYLFAVNDEEQPHEAVFKLPRMPKSVVQEMPEGGSAPLPKANAIRASFAGFEMKVYKIIL